jgi:hypothetical protein
LILLALSPLLLLLADNTGLTIAAIILTVLAFLFVLLFLVALASVMVPFQELALRRTVLDERGVMVSLTETFGLIKRHLKDVIIVWLLMFGVGIAWVFVALFAVLPAALIAALLIGGIPAGLIYLLSGSGMGAAVVGGPLAVLALVAVISFGSAFYLILQSVVWTLTYLELQKMDQLPTNGVDQNGATPAPVAA